MGRQVMVGIKHAGERTFNVRGTLPETSSRPKPVKKSSPRVNKSVPVIDFKERQLPPRDRSDAE